MFGSRALTLTIGGQEFTFKSTAEFEFALSGRTNLPADKFSELSVLSQSELKQEARNIKAVEQRFVEILSRSLEQPGSIATLMQQLDLKVFSQDHDWREIVRALADKGAEADAFRHIALVKYMQYLTGRQEMIKQAYRIKKQERERARTLLLAGDSRPGDVSQEMEVPGESAFRETVIFDSALIEIQDRTEQTFTRLPKGEATVVQLAPGDAIDIMLSKHPFRFTNEGHGRLEDANDNVYELSRGKNIVGRDAVCNVMVDPDLRDVSRLHLIIEPLTERAFGFTDLSSHGTFLPNHALAQKA